MSEKLSVYAYTLELDALRRFYEGGLAIKPAFRSGNWLPFHLGGATFALHGTRDDSHDLSHRFHLSFDVADIGAAVARFEAAGAQVLRGASDEAFGKRAIVQDPDGRQLEIVQHEV